MSIISNLFSNGLTGIPKQAYTMLISKYYKDKAISSLKNKKSLWVDLNNYIQKSESSGCSFIDYSYLYEFIIKNKPKEILECGTGVTTIVMAHALKDAKIKGRITSMESHDKWYEMSKDLLPKSLASYVDFVLSPVTEDYYSFFRGTRYKSIPKRQYDLVFVDGPTSTSPTDGTHLFNYDFFHVLKNSDKPVQAIIDKRLSTIWFLQKVLGDKVFYDPIRKLGIVKPSTRFDIRTISKLRPSISFDDSISVFNSSNLNPKFTDYLNEKK
tara:strand:- start:359 stop:1165 length:807 start_codon:yes stop_codon:yes gene_type:complete